MKHQKGLGGSIRFPSDVSDTKKYNKDYLFGKCITRPMTAEEKLKYGEPTIIVDKVLPLLQQGLQVSEIAEKLKVDKKAINFIVGRYRLAEKIKIQEEDLVEDATPTIKRKKDKRANNGKVPKI